MYRCDFSIFRKIGTSNVALVRDLMMQYNKNIILRLVVMQFLVFAINEFPQGIKEMPYHA